MWRKLDKEGVKPNLDAEDLPDCHKSSPVVANLSM